jgi:probable addiction module antidote protein
MTTMAPKTTKWDVAEFLDSEERIAMFLEAAFEEDDPGLITAALGDVARARGMTQMAKDTGFSREALYRALSRDGRPEFNTVLKVMKAFGLRLSPIPIR